MPTLKFIVGNKISYLEGDIPRRRLDELLYSYTVQLGSMKGQQKTKVKLIEPQDGRLVLFSGLVHELVGELKFEYKIEIEDQRRRANLSPAYVDVCINKINKDLQEHYGWTLRDHQERAVRMAVDPHCSFEMATASGKTLVIASILRLYNYKSLVLVDSRELMAQAADEIGRLIPRSKIGMIGDGIYEDRDIVVGIVDTLVNKPEYLKTVQHIICDEAHLSAANTFRYVMMASDAHVRHGFTGTYLRNQKDEIKILKAMCGPLKVKVTCSELIEKKEMSKPIITMVKVPCKWRIKKELPYEVAIRKYIVGNKERNKLGCEYIKSHYLKQRRILVFVSRISHGKNIRQMLIDNYDIPDWHVEFVSGKSGGFLRENALERLESGELPILICTKLFEKGINVPSVDVGVNFKGEYTEIGCRQTLGRLLRGDGVCYYLDFYDTVSGMLETFSKHRMRIYKSERAFSFKLVNRITEDSRDGKPESKGFGFADMFRSVQGVSPS